MTAAVDDAVITHGLEYTSANLYVNKNLFTSITIFRCAFSYGALNTLLPWCHPAHKSDEGRQGCIAESAKEDRSLIRESDVLSRT
jgi:hypothetical protein